MDRREAEELVELELVRIIGGEESFSLAVGAEDNTSLKRILEWLRNQPTGIGAAELRRRLDEEGADE